MKKEWAFDSFYWILGEKNAAAFDQGTTGRGTPPKAVENVTKMKSVSWSRKYETQTRHRINHNTTSLKLETAKN